MNAKVELTANGKRWTKAHDKQLTRMYVEQNMTHEDMGEILGRTTWAVGARISALKLRAQKKDYKQETKLTNTINVPANSTYTEELNQLHQDLHWFQYATLSLAAISLVLVGTHFM